MHWVVWDLPGDLSGLAEAASAGSLPGGAREGSNSWNRTPYAGPCPPSGTHRYVHKLFALDGSLGDLGRPTAEELSQAIRHHVVASAELVATYRRRR